MGKRKEEAIKKDKDNVVNNMNEITLYLDGVAKQIAQQNKTKGEVMVEESLLRLEVRKLREILNAKADEVFSLEAKKIELNMAMEERSKELSVQRDLLRMQWRQAEEERSSATTELRERVRQVEMLKKRYEILMSQLSQPEGEDGDDDGPSGEHTQAYYIIKAAQRKEKLQKEGDDLDRKIKKAEKEVRELENTLRFMMDHNEDYRVQ